MRRTIVTGCVGVLAGLLLSAGGGQAAQGMPFVGVWDCEVGTFTFTNQTYNPGDQMLVIKDIAVVDGDYVLSFEDGYQIGLSGITDTEMAWLSGETGDAFTCKKLYD